MFPLLQNPTTGRHFIDVAGTQIAMTEDGLFRITDLHKAAGGLKKDQPSDWLRLDHTKRLIELLEERETSRGTRPGTEQNQVLRRKIGGHPDQQGTFICRKLVHSYAMWISPEFELKVLDVFDAFLESHIQNLEKQSAKYLENLQFKDQVLDRTRKDLRYRQLDIKAYVLFLKRSERREKELTKQLEEERKFSQTLLTRLQLH